MKILSFCFGGIQKFCLAILGIFSLFLLGRNSRLSSKNKKLNKYLVNQNKTIEIQERIIDVNKNTKPANINGNIERMRQEKL